MKIAILNSRQNLRPDGCDPWILQSESAVKLAIENNHIILTSVGLKNWEVVLYFASKFKARIELYLPSYPNGSREEAKRFYINQFRLDADRVEWRFVEIQNNRDSKHIFQKERDRLIVERADLIWPISIRPGSTLKARYDNKTVENHFRIEYAKPNADYKIDIDRSLINSRIDERLHDYLIHWTRAANSAWPGERLYDYYKSIIECIDEYSHSGLNTLVRILSEGIIRASSNYLRQGVSAVGLSGLKPIDSIGLMKWRARYRQMSFEPYGIAIKRDFAESIGIKRVFYGNPEMYQYLEEPDRPYFQSLGMVGDWQEENEFRHINDIDLKKIPEDQLAVIVLRQNEVDKLRAIFSGKIYSFYGK